MIEAYPLCWPHGFKRTEYPERSRFRHVSFASARDGLLKELDMLGASDVILSTNIPLRRDGLPYSSQKQPNDKGVSVYFKMNKQPRSIACDKWDRIEDNIHALELTVSAMALELTVSAMRGLDRWGASDVLDRVFTGFMSLPPPSDGSNDNWWEVLKVSRDAKIDEVERKYRDLSKVAHPDMGGSSDMMSRLNIAVRKAREALL